MEVTRDSVLEALGRVVTRSITLPALADDMGLKKQHYAKLKTVLAHLEDEGLAAPVVGGGWALAKTNGKSAKAAAQADDETPFVPATKKPDKAPVTGRITVHPAGYGFVVSEKGEDVFIPAKYRGPSLDGDRVIVETWLGYK